MKTEPREPSFPIAMTALALVVAILSLGMFVLGADLHGLLIVCIVVTAIICKFLGLDYEKIEVCLCDGINRAVTSLFIFILIGMLMGSWTQSGTVPALVYYGLRTLSPSWFLPAGYVVTAVMAFATGSCWGTGGTLGVALLGIGAGMNIPIPLVAGMVISGSYFGDKMAPVSDTNNLSTANSGADLYGHIAAMAKTAIPTFIISLVLYAVIGLRYSSVSYDAGAVDEVCRILSSEFHISFLSLLPLGVLLVVSFLKVPAVVALLAGVLSGDVIAVTTQGVGLAQILHCWNKGFSGSTGNAIVDQVLNNGGIQSMMWTFSLAFLGIALGGLLDGSGILRVIIEHVTRWVRSAFVLVLVTIVSSVASNVVMGENYLSSILNSRLWGTAYDKLGLQRRMLSRCVEEGATLSSPLIPWTTAGAFFYGAFKMSPITYLPFAFTNYICPLLSIVLVFFGLTIVRVPAEGAHDPYYERERRNLAEGAEK